MELFNQGSRIGLRKKIRTSVIVIVAVLLMAAGGCVALCLFTTLQNAAAMQVAFSVLAVAAGWTVIAVACCSLLPALRGAKRVGRLLAAEQGVFCGVVSRIGGELTRSHFVYTELTVEEDGKQVILYWDRDFPLPFAEGAKVRFTAADRVVLSATEGDGEE